MVRWVIKCQWIILSTPKDFREFYVNVVNWLMQYTRFGTPACSKCDRFGAWAMVVAWWSAIQQSAGRKQMMTHQRKLFTRLLRRGSIFLIRRIYMASVIPRMLGEIIEEKNMIIATKGRQCISRSVYSWLFKKTYRSACEDSSAIAKRNDNYYQLHTARPATPAAGECIEAMQYLQQQGKVRYWGCHKYVWSCTRSLVILSIIILETDFSSVECLNQKALPLLNEASAKG